MWWGRGEGLVYSTLPAALRLRMRDVAGDPEQLAFADVQMRMPPERRK
jgi:hypothetical protein